MQKWREEGWMSPTKREARPQRSASAPLGGTGAGLRLFWSCEPQAQARDGAGVGWGQVRLQRGREEVGLSCDWAVVRRRGTLSPKPTSKKGWKQLPRHQTKGKEASALEAVALSGGLAGEE